MEVYGTTETSGGITSTNGYEPLSGTSGGPLSSLKIKLVDLPQFGYFSTDIQPRGEIYVKGVSLF